MPKWKIFLSALMLMAIAVAVLAKDQLSRNIILLKSGSIIPVDRVWESGADLFYENDKEIHFVSLADIQSIEKQSLSIWMHTVGTRVANFAGTWVTALNPIVKNGLELTRRPILLLWLLIGSVATPVGIVLMLRSVRKRQTQKKTVHLAAPAKETCQAMPNRADVVRYFLMLYRHQLGFGPEVLADFVQLSSASDTSNLIYELRVKSGGEWIKRRMTLGPLGEDSGSKSKCYYVIFDQHLVVKIPPKPITDFEDYVASIKKERHIVERLSPKECIVPKVSVILSQVYQLASPFGSPPEQL
jgi:hypothetical protein